ncbi:PTS transporter subunit IIC [Streptococcus sp. H49]|uniref:PTS transporter subunit IIC n=1 Tax=Streptococcus huangxiaojuni TaxID=3237239 RepID=UPI0034A3BBE4
MLNIINTLFNSFIGLGGAAMMFVVLTILALFFGAKPSKALEGGLRMAVALTGMGAIISLLTEAFAPALNAFVDATGIALSITDLGWAPLAVITWGSIYTLYFAFICILLNLFLLALKVTNTLNVDLFNIWNVSIVGLLTNYYARGNLIVTSLFVLFIYTFMLLNADAMKPVIGKLLDFDEHNITTTAHPSFLIAPLAMVVNKLIDKSFPFIDKYDFDADTLNKKIGFWGSKFAIGAYLGVFIGILGQRNVSNILTLAFTGGVALELFNVVGGWFGPAIEPLSNGVQSFMAKRMRGRKLFVAIDWPIVASRAEVWAVMNILAPILLLVSMVLPGNNVMPLGGILLTVLTPALLIVTGGKVIRMTLIGTVLIPIYLWSATLVADFITSTSISMGNFPKGLESGQLFTSIDSNPIEKMLAILFGKSFATFDFASIAISLVCMLIYTINFLWYRNELRR